MPWFLTKIMVPIIPPWGRTTSSFSRQFTALPLPLGKLVVVLAVAAMVALSWLSRTCSSAIDVLDSLENVASCVGNSILVKIWLLADSYWEPRVARKDITLISSLVYSTWLDLWGRVGTGSAPPTSIIVLMKRLWSPLREKYVLSQFIGSLDISFKCICFLYRILNSKDSGQQQDITIDVWFHAIPQPKTLLGIHFCPYRSRNLWSNFFYILNFLLRHQEGLDSSRLGQVVLVSSKLRWDMMEELLSNSVIEKGVASAEVVMGLSLGG